MFLAKIIKKGITNLKQYAFDMYDQIYLNFSNNVENFSPILDSQDLKQLDIVLNLYFRMVCEQLAGFIETNIQSDISTQTQIQSIGFAVFLVSLLCFFLFYWYPTITGMNSAVDLFYKKLYILYLIKINRTISMLNIIPTKVIRECASIRRKVKQLIKEIEKI